MMELGKQITVLKQGNMDDLEEDMSDFPGVNRSKYRQYTDRAIKRT